MTYQVSDGALLSATTISTIEITPLNDAPTLAGASTLTVAKNHAAAAINKSLVVADIDNTTLASATVQLTSNYASREDELGFVSNPTTTGNILGSFDGRTGTMTLTSPGATATVAQFQAALRVVSYRNNSSTPTTLPRSVEYQVSDGSLTSNTVTSLVTIKVVGSAPLLAEVSNLNYTEKQAATPINPILQVSDADSGTLAWATVRISSNYSRTQDVLDFVGDESTGNITGSYNAASGILTLISLDGSASVEQFQSALRRVTYDNTSSNPSTLTRYVSFQVSDGSNLSSSLVSSITVTTGENDAPLLAGTSTVTYKEDQVAAPSINKSILVTDVDSAALVSATVSLATNYFPFEDVLGFVPSATTGDIEASFSLETGTLTLTSLAGQATVAQFQAALRLVTYRNTSGNPSTAIRYVEYQVSDGSAISNVVTSQISVIALNDAPSVAGVNTLAYTEKQSATPINPIVTVSDVDSDRLALATVRISAGYSAKQDFLGFVGDESTGDITGSFVSGTMTLTSAQGTATVSQFEAALRRVTYFNSSNNPSTVSRSVTYQVSDGALLSTTAISTIVVTPLNDAPTLAGVSTLTVAKNQTAASVNKSIIVADIDSTTLASATVRIASNFTPGEDVLGFVGNPLTTGNILGSFDSGTGIMTLTSPGTTATVAQFQAALRLVTYRNISSTPSTAPRSVEYQVTDGSLTSNPLISLVTIKVAGQAPTLAGVSGLHYLEKQPATTINPVLDVTDADSATLAWATVKISSNYSSTQDVLEFVGDESTGNITGSFNPAAGILTLISLDASATAEQFQSALRLVTYRNTSPNPSILTRYVSFQVSDGSNLSNMVVSYIYSGIAT